MAPYLVFRSLRLALFMQIFIPNASAYGSKCVYVCVCMRLWQNFIYHHKRRCPSIILHSLHTYTYTQTHTRTYIYTYAYVLFYTICTMASFHQLLIFSFQFSIFDFSVAHSLRYIVVMFGVRYVLCCALQLLGCFVCTDFFYQRYQHARVFSQSFVRS